MENPVGFTQFLGGWRPAWSLNSRGQRHEGGIDCRFGTEGRKTVTKSIPGIGTFAKYLARLVGPSERVAAAGEQMI